MGVASAISIKSLSLPGRTSLPSAVGARQPVAVQGHLFCAPAYQLGCSGQF